jgi:hypothetical protein
MNEWMGGHRLIEKRLSSSGAQSLAGVSRRERGRMGGAFGGRHPRVARHLRVDMDKDALLDGPAYRRTETWLDRPSLNLTNRGRSKQAP